MSQIMVILSVFFVTTSGTHDYKVFVTKNKYEADLWVWRSKVKYEGFGKEEFWFQTNSKYQSSFTVKYIKLKYKADLIVYFVDNKYQAGWRKNHPLKNNLFQLK